MTQAGNTFERLEGTRQRLRGREVSAAGLDGAIQYAAYQPRLLSLLTTSALPRYFRGLPFNDPGLSKVLASLRKAARAAGLLMLKSKPW